MGLAEGLDWESLRPFVASLRQTTFDGELHLFVSRTSRDTVGVLRREGVFVHLYRTLRFEHNARVFHAYDPPLRRFRTARFSVAYPGLLKAAAVPARDRLRAQARLAAPISIPYVGRFLRFFRFLASSGERYANVMVTDVRDVFFQRDPFDFDLDESLNCFLEDESHLLGTQQHNREWLLAAYGERVLEELAGKPISCSGVTIGPRDAMIDYLRAMSRELMKLKTQTIGIDQGVHNYVVYRDQVSHVRLLRNGEGPVLTLALMPPSDVDSLLNENLLAANVLHQYNHHPRLASELLDSLTNCSNPRRR